MLENEQSIAKLPAKQPVFRSALRPDKNLIKLPASGCIPKLSTRARLTMPKSARE